LPSLQYNPDKEEMMQRTRQIERKPDAILTSDWHLRETTPICFIGDFQKEQWTAVKFISSLQKKYGCVVLHAGDLFDHWKPSPWLLSMTISMIPDRFYTIYGQHDLPQHSLELQDKSGINVLRQAEKLTVLSGCHWGQAPNTNFSTNFEFGEGGKILVWHHLTYQTKPFPGAEGGMAAGILRKYPQFDLIVTGDNHQSFTEEYQGRLLVNPGNLTRQVADQIAFRPRVYLWYADTNTVEPIYIPIQEGAISREHLEVKEKRDARIDAFVSGLNKDWTAELSFEHNLEKFKQTNIIRRSVLDLVYKAIG
jgi:DNA repair exonuclease SbcCD nuclease subunit